MNKHKPFIIGLVILLLGMTDTMAQDLATDLEKIYANFPEKEGFGLQFTMQYYNERGIPETGEEIKGEIIIKGDQYLQKMREEVVLKHADCYLTISTVEKSLVIYPPREEPAQNPKTALKALQKGIPHTFAQAGGIGTYTFLPEGSVRFAKITFSFDLQTHRLLSYGLYQSSTSEESVRIFYESLDLSQGEIRKLLKKESYIKETTTGFAPQKPYTSYQIIDLTAQP